MEELALEHVQSLIFLHDLSEDKIRFLNGHVKRLLGHNPAEPLSGSNFRKLIDPEDLALFDDLVGNLGIYEPGERVDLKLRVHSREDGERWLHGSYSVVDHAPDGSPRAALAVLEDMTDRHRLLDALERKAFELEATLSALPDAYLRVDRNLVVTRCLHAPRVGFIANCKEIVGRPLDRALPAGVHRLVRGLVESATSLRKPMGSEFLFPENPESSFEIRLIPLLRDELMIIFRSLSERALAERDAREQRGRR
jgi:PAS domain S-box-containing protein